MIERRPLVPSHLGRLRCPGRIVAARLDELAGEGGLQPHEEAPHPVRRHDPPPVGRPPDRLVMESDDGGASAPPSSTSSVPAPCLLEKSRTGMPATPKTIRCHDPAPVTTGSCRWPTEKEYRTIYEYRMQTFPALKCGRPLGGGGREERLMGIGSNSGGRASHEWDGFGGKCGRLECSS